MAKKKQPKTQQYTARARCTIMRKLLIEAVSLEEAREKAKKWDCIDEEDDEMTDYEILSVEADDPPP